MKSHDWQIDEFRQIGTDYTDIKEVQTYDERMEVFRDFERENRAILDMLCLPEGASVLDVGCGTGRFVRFAAAAGLKPTCADISPVMLDYVRSKAQQEGLGEIGTQHAGFITLDFPPETFDAVVAGVSLHHLPDLWKLPALINIAGMLKPEGQFIMRDVVFSVEPGTAPEHVFEQFVESLPSMRKEVARHVADEFSTYDWIIEGLLIRAGFRILNVNKLSDAFAVYHCRKI